MTLIVLLMLWLGKVLPWLSVAIKLLSVALQVLKATKLLVHLLIAIFMHP